VIETPETFVAIGALLARARDVDAAAKAIADYVIDPSEANRDALGASGVSAERALDFRHLLPTDRPEVARLCELGRAWAMGRQSNSVLPSWHPVVTTGEVDAGGIDRMTAETMIGLIVGARVSLRIFSPFLDARGLDVLGVALAAATRRGVRTSIGYARRGNRDNAIDQLQQRIRASGEPKQLQTVAMEGDRPFPHLKLIAADGERAYIGSANLTWPALTSNAEVGALVDGEPVRVLERWFDAVIASQPVATPNSPMRAESQ
jgi:phosphatidylserine/phosphatidylglycerophosphate/cardiolipin synthase-like enzyme